MSWIPRFLFLVLALIPASVLAQPTFTKAFAPSTIGPGSTTTLEYSIRNASGAAVTQIAFSEALPAGLVIASPANPSSSCTGGGGRDGASPVIDAPEGGSALTYSGGGLGASSTCTVRVDVTSATPGTVTSTSSPLTSSAGTSPAATADLTVAADRPGFSASLSPAAVTLSGRSTLTYLIDNTLNPGGAYMGGFAHTLPTGVILASPANATTTCPSATLVATAGSATVTLTGNQVTPLAGGTSCTVTVDVVGNATGRLANATGELTTAASIFGIQRSSGTAGVALDVLREALLATKAFATSPTAPGETVRMDLTLKNLDRNGTATAVAVSEDLEGTLPGLLATGLPTAACQGTLSTPDGGRTIEFSGGVLASGEACVVSVDLVVPTATAVGTYTSTTGQASATVNGEEVLGSPAVAQLVVASAPVLSLSFVDDPVSAGSIATLEYAITNTSLTSTASGVSFTDDLADLFGDTFTSTLPAGGFCGLGSTAFIGSAFPGSARTLTISNGTLAPGETCTFDVVVDVPLTVTGGTYTNTTRPVSATIDGQTLEGNAATDVLQVVDVPLLSKDFPDGATAPGGTSLVRFTLQFDTEVEGAASDLAFTDDLDAMLLGLVATGLPFNACGGTVSSPDFGSTLAFSGGTLGATEVCSFDVALDVPTTAPNGVFSNTTSPLSGTVGGVSVLGVPATAQLVVTSLSFTKAFVDDPVAPGGTVTLAYTLRNDDPTAEATGLFFTDDLDGALTGLASTSGTLTDGCGVGSSISGTTQLIFSGGSLAAGEACTVSVTLAVPPTALPSAYRSPTSTLSATIGGTSATLPAAADELTVATDTPPLFSASFDPAVIADGGRSTVVLTVDNAGNGATASALDVTDSFPAGMSVASPANAASTCVGGTVTAVGGATSVSYSGGEVAGGATCTVSVDVEASGVGTFINTTGDLTSSLGNSGPATASLDVRAVELSATKTVEIVGDDGDGEADPGEVLRYTLSVSNTSSRTTVALALDDTPDDNTSIVPGSVVTSQGTVLAEAPSVSVALGSVPAGAVATVIFDVAVDLPIEAGVLEVCNQGRVTGNAVDLLTDDPTTPGLDGATCIATDPNEPPVADAGDDQSLECAAPTGTPAALDGTASSDPDGDALDYLWTGAFTEGGGTVSGAEPTVTLALGEHLIGLTVSDPSGASDSDDVTILVSDTAAPALTLNGDAEVTLVRFAGPYVELGAEAADACEGPVGVTVSGAVDTTVPGVSLITYTASDGTGNVAESTRTVTVVDDPDAILSPYLALAEDEVRLNEQARTEGDLHSNDKVELKKGLAHDDGGPSLHLGNVTASDEVKVHDRQRVDGDVRADRVDLKNGAVVTGMVIQSAAPLVALPSVSVSATGTDVAVATNGSLTLIPGAYGKLKVGRGATLHLASGAYVFEEIKLEDGARIEVLISTGPTVVEVERKLEADDDVVILPLPYGEADARYVTFRVAGNKVDFGDDNEIAAQILAPEAHVSIGDRSRYVGAITAEKVEFEQETVALYVTMVGPSELIAVGVGSGSADATADPSAPEIEAPLPEAFELSAAYPNPLRQIATVRYAMPVAASAHIAVYDALGREVARLVDGPMEAGRHQATFVSDGLPSGSYLLRMTTSEGFAQTQALTVIR